MENAPWKFRLTASLGNNERVSHKPYIYLTLHLRDGFIITDIYAKPTDSHLYLPFYSSHPPHCKRAIPYGVALRIKRNCSTDEFLQNRQDEYKGYLKSQNYPGDPVDKQFQKALRIPRPELLTKKNKSDKKVFPLVLDYNPILPDIQKSSGNTSIYYTLHLRLKKFSQLNPFFQLIAEPKISKKH